MTKPIQSLQSEVWTQFETQLEYVKLTDRDREALRLLSPNLLPMLPGIISRFYDHLQSFPVTKGLLSNPQRIEKLKAAQLDYFQKMLEGTFDEQYIQDRKKIGDTHVRAGLPPKWYLGAYAFYCDTLFPLFQELFQDDPSQAVPAQAALMKAFFLDIQLAIESYIDSYAGELLQVQTALEKRLWLEDRLLSFILNEATDAIVGLDDQDRICTWSQGAQRLFGYKTTEILDKSLHDLIREPELIQKLSEDAQEKGYTSLQGEYWKTKQNKTINANATLTYLSDRHGNHIGATLLIQDRTEARQMAEKVKSMEQLTAMTKITAGVAHEIRTPLGIIALTSDLLEKRVAKILNHRTISIHEEEKADISDLVADLQMEVVRLNEIVDHYLVLSRIRRPQKTKIRLQPFLKSIIEELAKNHSGAVQWDLRAQDNLRVEIDTDQFRRIFHNLNENSLHAIEDKGVIKITAFSPDHHVQIIFQDNGAGIPHDHMQGVFSAFVTHRSGGTGLGLYLVREIVEAHQGSVSIESEPGKGTAVIITLPLTLNED